MLAPTMVLIPLKVTLQQPWLSNISPLKIVRKML